jgi:riboflavin kinase/FMN adenylyltransferase
VIASLDPAHPPIPPPSGSVVSIGVFDGVHLGHQAILAENRACARELGADSAVITFRRHPKRVLLGREPRTLTSLEHRLELFRQAGIDRVLVLTFDEALRDLSPEAFVERYAVGVLGARAFVLGFDSKFGRDRRGTPELLARLGYDVHVVRGVLVGGRPVSSTAIREAVELGDLEGARRMLGRPVSVLGTVVAGDRRGRTLGFPTANLNLHHELHPPIGVYAGRARVFRRGRPEEASEHLAVANVGFRPTVGGGTPAEPTFEVHLLDFGGDLYGATVEFQFAGRLRGEQRFESLTALSSQIRRDVEAARALLRAEPAAAVDGPSPAPR